MNRASLRLVGMLGGGLAILAAGAVAWGGEKMSVDVPSPKEALATLVKDHPRVMARAADFERIRTRVAKGGPVAEWYEKVKAHADKILGEEPSKYEIPDGRRLLATSRRVLDRVTTLAMVWHVSGDKRYVERAWKELSAAAAFKDWNPPHFLDTAEMTLAFGLGYDWLYTEWSPEQRKTLREAIVRHGLEPGLACYEARGASNWWPRASHNWNQVCNGGLVGGALAIADEEPRRAAQVVAYAVECVRLPMFEFNPDGAWAEGPGYWDYATSYNVYMLAALETALGTDFGLAAAPPGFAETGLFPIYVTGPLGTTFDFADVHPNHHIRAPQMFWLARRFGRPHYAAYQYEHAAPEALDLLWDPDWRGKELEPLALGKHFRGADIVTMRSAWGDPAAAFVGLKGGSNAVNHSHLDLGSFELDWQGVRWAVDLGSDNYNLPRYFDVPKTRWTYYRLRAEGHNTLVINPGQGPDQDPKAIAPITHFTALAHNQGFTATVDLTAAYAPSGATRVERAIELVGNQHATVTDEVQLKAPGDLWWFLHTEAEVALADGGRAATLTQDGKSLHVKLVDPATATFTVMDAAPLPTSPNPEGQNRNEGVRKLAIHLSKVEGVTIRIAMSPGAAAK